MNNEQEKPQDSKTDFFKKNAAEIVKQTGDNLQEQQAAEHLRNTLTRKFDRND